MTRKVQRFVGSLGFRLLASLAITVAVVLGIHAAFGFKSLHEQFQGLLHSDAQRLSDLIQRATHDGMLENRLDEVQTVMARMAEGPGVVAIRVFDKDGAVVLSARPDEVGHRVALRETPCRDCHPTGEPVTAARAERTSIVIAPGGQQVLRRLSALENEPECSNASCHAHAPGERLLGVLDVELSLAPMNAAHRETRNRLLGTTILLILITGIISWVFVRNLVLRPVSQLSEATDRVASGDLTTRIEVRGRHELARLADSFNHMTRDLDAAQREIRDWSEKLEEKVVERTEELHRTQRQVLHMEKMASLGKLSATVAHELNNPISGILTYARLVERELESQDLAPDTLQQLRRQLGLIQKECLRTGDIVRNLLLFARRDTADMGPSDLRDVVERSLMLVRHHAEMHNVGLEADIPEQDLRLHADAGQLQQALVALCVNGIEAMAQDGDQEGQLTVKVRADDGHLTIEVSDTGVGISPELLPQIFEPFFSTKNKEAGVGLGLAVVYGIIHRHGGEIDVESDVGRGTRFRIRLPRLPSGATSRATDAEPTSSPARRHP